MRLCNKTLPFSAHSHSLGLIDISAMTIYLLTLLHRADSIDHQPEVNKKDIFLVLTEHNSTYNAE